MLKENQKGFGHHFIFIALILVVVGFVGWRVFSKNHGSNSAVSSATVASSTKTCPSSTATGCSGQTTHKFDPSGGKCKGKGLVPFTSAPLPLSQIGLVEPLGQMIGGHVTPIDHGYIFGIHGHQGSKTNEYP